jgi:CDK inhibitor PHO81
LEKQYLIQITLGQPYSKYHLDRTEPSVTITPWTSTFAGTTLNNRPESLLKMVMTSRTNDATTPISLTLPLSGERDVFTFQVQDLSELSLEFSFFPQIGSKTIGRAAVLPTVFENVKDSKEISLAILDHKLHIIGKVIFEACIIRPFEDVTLQLGGAVETYWKSSSQYTDQSVPGVLPISTPTLIGSAHTSPSNRSAVMHPSGCLTISSLSHEFLHIVVQSTRDMVPVVFSEWNIPTDELNVGVSDITLAQFQKLATRTGKALNTTNAQSLPINQWAERINGSMGSLESLLAV